MKRMLRMFMHSHPSGFACYFRDIAGVYLVIGQGRDTLRTLACRFRDFAISELLDRPLRTSSFPS
jgi:hypothetical protein